LRKIYKVVKKNTCIRRSQDPWDPENCQIENFEVLPSLEESVQQNARKSWELVEVHTIPKPPLSQPGDFCLKWPESQKFDDYMTLARIKLVTREIGKLNIKKDNAKEMGDYETVTTLEGLIENQTNCFTNRGIHKMRRHSIDACCPNGA